MEPWLEAIKTLSGVSVETILAISFVAFTRENTQILKDLKVFFIKADNKMEVAQRDIEEIKYAIRSLK